MSTIAFVSAKQKGHILIWASKWSFHEKTPLLRTQTLRPKLDFVVMELFRAHVFAPSFSLLFFFLSTSQFLYIYIS